MYVFLKCKDHSPPLWTAGFFKPDGEWEPESDHRSEEEAAERGAMDAIFFKHSKTIFIDDIEIPATWRTFASFDLGSTRPWAWLAFAESDGTDFQYKNGRVGRSLPGDLFLIGEVYGWDGAPDKGDHASIAEITTRIQNYKIQRRLAAVFRDTQRFRGFGNSSRHNFEGCHFG